MPDMDFAEFLQQRAIWEASGNRLMRKEEVERFDAFFADNEESSAYQSAGFTRALAGDFSQFETVEPMMKGYLGAKKCYDLYDRYQGDLGNPQLQQEIKERLMEVDLRTGFAFGGKDPTDPFSVFLKGCERIANQQMLIQTLEGPDATAKLRLIDQLRQQDPNTAQEQLLTVLGEDLEQRVEIAKILFMNHLGKFQLYDGQEQTMQMQENVAELYTHGGRTMFILPAGKNQKPVTDSIQGSEPTLSGLKRRSFATHAVKPRKLHADGSIAAEAKEVKARGFRSISAKPRASRECSSPATKRSPPFLTILQRWKICTTRSPRISWKRSIPIRRTRNTTHPSRTWNYQIRKQKTRPRFWGAKGKFKTNAAGTSFKVRLRFCALAELTLGDCKRNMAMVQ